MEHRPLALGAWSRNYWTTREVSGFLIFEFTTVSSLFFPIIYYIRSSLLPSSIPLWQGISSYLPFSFNQKKLHTHQSYFLRSYCMLKETVKPLFTWQSLAFKISPVLEPQKSHLTVTTLFCFISVLPSETLKLLWQWMGWPRAVSYTEYKKHL